MVGSASKQSLEHGATTTRLALQSPEQALQAADDVLDDDRNAKLPQEHPTVTRPAFRIARLQVPEFQLR